MKKTLLAFVLTLSGCLSTQTKPNLTRPDFSKPHDVAATGTSSCGCCKKIAQAQPAPKTDDGGIDQMLRETDEWLNAHPEYDPSSRSF